MDEPPPSARPPASWRRWSGLIVVGVLAIILIWLNTHRDAGRGSATGGPASTATNGSDAPASEASADPVVVIEGALQAWGQFAIDGDLDRMAPFFWADGPQWANLENDAADILVRSDPGPSYLTSVVDAHVVDATDGQQTVVAGVTFGRTGESTQTLRWRISLHRRDGRWAIWSITTTP